ncbi:MAG: hypothetical protein PHS80_07355 [Methanothrix sp.]|nr:hypothetical protein [Methanothrix sp.]
MQASAENVSAVQAEPLKVKAAPSVGPQQEATAAGESALQPRKRGRLKKV